MHRKIGERTDWMDEETGVEREADAEKVGQTLKRLPPSLSFLVSVPQ